MLDEEICKLRKKLNESILNGDDYSITYKLSVELDELIARYYEKGKRKELVWYRSKESYMIKMNTNKWNNRNTQKKVDF